MFDSLIKNLDTALKNFKGQGKITESNLTSTVKEIKRALVHADVEYKLAKEITDDIKAKALGAKILCDVSPKQFFIKIVNDHLANLMGGASADISLVGNPAVVLMIGLQGAGKTTLSVKLADHIKRKKSKQVLLAACDIYRPAAIEQLKILANSVGIEVYAEEEKLNPIEIAKNAVRHAKENNKQVVIIDTAGRLSIDEAMMQEIYAIKQATNPSETLFVVDAMIGQDAVKTAKTFHERLNFDGVVLTKLDGDARGGAALSIAAVVGKPIKYVGLGEKITDLEIFHPDRMANRILGMGDVVSLVEKAEELYDKEQADLLDRKIKKDQFDFNDFVSQIKKINSIGSLKSVLSFIPGMGGMADSFKQNEHVLNKFIIINQSMTPYERANPSKIDKDRTKRISYGSGIPLAEVSGMIKKFLTMKDTMRRLSKSKNMLEAIQQKMRQ